MRVLLLLLCLFPDRHHAVVSPLEKLSEEVLSMQDTVNSIQASLMASVGLIQDQVSELSHRLTAQFDSKLVSLDKKLDSLTSSMLALQERAGQWESLQPHLQVLSTTTSEIDNKVEHFTRTHRDQLNEHSRNSEFRQEDIARKMEQFGSTLQAIDSRLLGLQDKVLLLPQIDAHVRNLTARNPIRFPNRRHRGGCHDTKELIEGLGSRLDILVAQMADSHSNPGPNFEFLRADPPDTQGGVSITQDDDLDSDYEDAKIINLIRKIVLPYKKTNKKLRDMESEQGKIETLLTGLETKLGSAVDDLSRKFGDFKIVATDMSQEQTHIIEGFGKNLAAVLQCCKGHSSDYSRFIASASPVIDRLDSWMVTWRGEVSQSLDRIQQQDSYHSGRLLEGHKELERLLLDGIDSCRRGRETATLGSSREESDYQPAARTPWTPPTTSTTTTLPPPITEIIRSPVLLDSTDTGVMYRDCMDLRMDGFTESKVYRVGEDRDWNLGGKDYNTRLCDMEVDGGGWTVIQNRGDFGEPRQNFTTTWEEYKYGFGELQGEFWFGNDFISRLSGERSYSLRVELEAWDERQAYAEYATFRLDDEASEYRLWVGGYSGNASDSLSVHNGYKFSTIDRNNDEAPKCCPCAPAYGGGWWFYSCFESNLNGDYFTNPTNNSYYRGIIWELWLGDYSLKKSRMMIRPRDLNRTPSNSFPVPPDP